MRGRGAFARLAVAHAALVAGDTLVTMALAGSIFFSISPHAARGRVALYLALTVAPFAVVAPLLGPALDRRPGGRRGAVVLSALGRAGVCVVMARHLNGLLLFPEAFAVLVLSKGYLVTRSALVPAAVRDERGLVEANARLAIIGVVAGFVAAAPGALLLHFKSLGGPWALRLAAAVFATGAVLAARMPRVTAPARTPASEDVAARELHAATIRLSAPAMAVLRAVVGFLTFLIAFAFRRSGVPSWWFGVALGASMAGSFTGNVVAPRLRRLIVEERILLTALLAVAAAGLIAARVGGRVSVAALAAVVGAAAAAGKVAFDAIVQRDAPDAVRGRTFARFETRFQLAWVAAAFVPVVVPIPSRLGMGVVSFGAAFAAFSYGAGRVALRRRSSNFRP